MLARRLPTILPPLTLPESLETSHIYSAVGRLKPEEPLLATRPFRSPHHTIVDAGMEQNRSRDRGSACARGVGRPTPSRGE